LVFLVIGLSCVLEGRRFVRRFFNMRARGVRHVQAVVPEQTADCQYPHREDETEDRGAANGVRFSRPVT